MMLLKSFFPLALLILSVLGAIMFGLATPTEAAAVGALGAAILAAGYRSLTWQALRESVFLTARTSAMVCWLFVGSATFASIFAYLGGKQIIKEFVLGMNLNPMTFLLLSQVDHLPARLAAGMDRDHHHLRADLPADAGALRHRPDPVRRAGRAQPADRVPVAADGDVGVLPQGGQSALACC